MENGLRNMRKQLLAQRNALILPVEFCRNQSKSSTEVWLWELEGDPTLMGLDG